MSDTGMGPARKLSLEKAQELIARYAVVKSTHKLAVEFGVSPITVSRTLERMGVTVGRNGRSLSINERNIAVVMHKNGDSIVAIAKHFGVVNRTVANVLRQKPLTPKQIIRNASITFTPEESQRIVNTYVAGGTTLALAKGFNVNSCTINKTLRRHGIAIRSRWQNHTEAQRVTNRRNYLSNPQKRLRALLVSRRSTAEERGFVFDHALFDLIAKNPPTHCACCDVALDFSDMRKRGTPNAPSTDRVDNKLGYVPGNVAVTCLRCNRLKSDASLEDLKRFIAYIERYRTATVKE